MNTVAFEENERNKEFITKNMRDGYLVLEIQGHKATYRGQKVSELGKEGKRKFENLLFLSNMPNQVKFLYV